MSVNPQTQEKTPLFIATMPKTAREDILSSNGLEAVFYQRRVVDELLKAGAVYQQEYSFPVNYGENSP